MGDNMNKRLSRTSRLYFSMPFGALCNEDGGDDTGGGGGQAQGQGDPRQRADRTDEQKGYPSNVPVAQMTTDQRASYWEDQSKKHESMLKAERRNLGGLTAEELQALRDKAAQHDDLEHELMSDKDKAVADAKKSAEAAAIPRVVRAEFRAAAKGVLTADQLTALLEDRDLTKYANAKGEPDEAKIEKLVEQFAPAKPATRTGPTSAGLGNHTATTTAGDQGRAQAAKRFGTKAAS